MKDLSPETLLSLSPRVTELPQAAMFPDSLASQSSLYLYEYIVGRWRNWLNLGV